MGSLTKDKLKWADAKDVKAALDATLESTIGPRETQTKADTKDKEVLTRISWAFVSSLTPPPPPPLFSPSFSRFFFSLFFLKYIIGEERS